MKKLSIIALLFILNTHLFAQEQLLDEIVAVVEDGVILRSDLDRAVGNVVKQIQVRGTQLPPKSILDTQVLERLITQEIQIQKADQAGVRVSEAELDAAMSQVAAQSQLTLQQMQMALENDGMNYAAFRNDMRREIKAEKIRNGFANQNVKVSQQEIDLFLADNDLSENEVRLGHILISVDANANDQSVLEAKDRADEIYQTLENGENFTELATKYSDGQKALDGGDLGWRPGNELPTLFADQIKVMKTGEYTHPVRSASGFHIIRLTEIREQTNKMIKQYHARHILIQNSELVTPAQGMELINEISRRLQDGEDFAEIAEAKSDDVNSAALGGDVGWFQVNEFGQRFGDVLKALDNQEISSPFQTQAGWHIMQRLAERESDVTEKYKRSQAEKALHSRKMNEEIESWLIQIRGESFVDIRI